MYKKYTYTNDNPDNKYYNKITGNDVAKLITNNTNNKFSKNHQYWE